MGASVIRQALASDAAVVAQLLFDFNREFDEEAPPLAVLTQRMRELIEGDDTLVLLGGEGPDGVAVLRLRRAIWSAGMEGYLAELYVVPEQRGKGLGRAIVEAVLELARRRGVDWMSIEVDEPDAGARTLYESLGFSNRVGGPDGPLMFVYEREL